ncbi:MAG TPA: aminotransferase class V-fold PLP-dependent enzyme [Candidatus Limnocylindrales bacterium]|nr:aminotransferase class V-fold PLP-dependent enzyme [Candidatus Limnocylindrales bacterium]
MSDGSGSATGSGAADRSARVGSARVGSATGRRLVDPVLLRTTAELAQAFLDSLPARPVGPTVGIDELRARLGGDLPEEPLDPTAVIESLASSVEGGLVASAGPRYFGFVVGGSHPAALAADWLSSAWDQNAAMYVMGPAAAVCEEVAGGWLKDVFGLPVEASVGYTSGATMASFTALAAGRHALLAREGWEVETRGLFEAPEIPVIVGDEAHVTIFAALQMLGLGRERVTHVASDEQGRMRPDALRDALQRLGRPALVCAQAGNVNSGAFDPLPAIVAAVRENGGWLHVDGAFGLWAAASEARRHLVAGVGEADSWTTDAHKWLNVPYDSGLVFCADAGAHQAAMTLGAAYYVETTGAERDPYNWVPESSRRARGVPIYATLRALGRRGLAELVEGCCQLAARFGQGLDGRPGVRVLNEVVLNQVVVRFSGPGDEAAAADERTRRVIGAIQRDGTLWAGGTTWRGRAALRISVSNWSTTEDDVDRSLEAILRVARECGVGA